MNKEHSQKWPPKDLTHFPFFRLASCAHGIGPPLEAKINQNTVGKEMYPPSRKACLPGGVRSQG